MNPVVVGLVVGYLWVELERARGKARDALRRAVELERAQREAEAQLRALQEMWSATVDEMTGGAS